MFPKYPVPQTEPPRSPKETLPTMYDLPSENLEEPGLPDEFHGLQPQLLSYTFRPSNYSASQIFTGSDMNLYYDSRHPLWYKRPDWFGVVGVSRLYDEVDMRLSYVVWQEAVNPFVIVELLSPGTEKEDLGENDGEQLQSASEQIAGNGNINHEQTQEKPLRKWQVYEQVLRIPYYVVFSRYTNRLRAFKLNGARYEELELSDSRLWMPEIDLGLGLWQGDYLGVDRLWLRWYDGDGNWILIPEERAEQAQERAEQAQERAEQERQRAETAETRLESLMQRLRESGINPDRFLNR
ncbi:Uma2 family endonuclease [Microcoleus sp. bin38.metabat.b11b12b14.051]|uniref:Uma2 family endonuclease n=1 Tax=Microcoleus sp. bin38.metabat.b11b12b14.051 TaxID=2742709 RepID=UPI0025DD10D7|nr:Uma2 family endonuclease [Microcoleus sp. bin38.metabat.b11b12b14.051]